MGTSEFIGEMKLGNDSRGRINQWVASREDEILEFAQDLIRIPSSPLTGDDEERVVKRTLEEFEKLGYDDAFIDDFGNVHGVIEGENDDAGALMFNSHLDTVGPGDASAWEHDPYAADVEDGRLYGLGAADMKSAVAAMVYAGGAIANMDFTPEHTIYVTGEIMETASEGHAMKYVVEDLGLDLCGVVVGEPTEMKVKRGHLGRVELTLHLEGETNPLYFTPAILERIEELSQETWEHIDLGTGYIEVTNLQPETPTNERAPTGVDLLVDRQLTLGESEADAYDELQEAVRTAREQYTDEFETEIETRTIDAQTWTGYRMEMDRNYPPWLMDEEHGFVQDAKGVVDDVLEKDTPITEWTFTTCGNYTKGVADIPTIGFGPADEAVVGEPDEHVAIEDVVDATKVYAGFGQKLSSHLSTLYPC